MSTDTKFNEGQRVRMLARSGWTAGTIITLTGSQAHAGAAQYKGRLFAAGATVYTDWIDEQYLEAA